MTVVMFQFSLCFVWLYDCSDVPVFCVLCGCMTVVMLQFSVCFVWLYDCSDVTVLCVFCVVV